MKGRIFMDNRGKRQASSLFGGMGFYIALLVCVVAAGVVGYFALLNNNDTQTEPPQTGDRTDPGPAQSVTAPGTVLSVDADGRLGTTIVVDHHNGYVTTYASLQPETAVLAGDTVALGDTLGSVGNTSLSEAGLGAHLHFSVVKDGQAVDPMEFLD